MRTLLPRRASHGGAAVGTELRATVRPGRLGFSGRGGGAASYVEAPPEFRGTSVQVCGLWPYAAGSGTPMTGVPVGRHLYNHSTVCCDPISWFARAQLIANPAAFVLGRPALGKSTLVRRMALGLAGYGVLPVVLGDLKPDYVDLVSALGGRVVRLGRGQGKLNVLDPGAARAAAERLSGRARTELLAEARARTRTMVAALVQLNRQRVVTDNEETILAAALEVLDERHQPGEAVLPDLVAVVEEGPERVRRVTLDRGDDHRYRAAVDPLQRSLIALCEGGLGDTFAHRTTVPMDLDAPLVIDISGIDDGDEKLSAAVLLACWGEGFGAIRAAHALSDAGLEPERHFFVILDELWRVLRAGKGLVDRVDALTRLNRQKGVGMALITHTMKDLLSVADASDRLKAQGFAGRAGFVVCAGLPASELPALEQVVSLSEAERRLINGWSTPPAWDGEAGREAEPPGRGKFLIKVGERPGIPLEVVLTPEESGVHDTNKRWHQTTTWASTTGASR